MSTSEELLLQAVGSNEAEDGNRTAHTGSLEPDDTMIPDGTSQGTGRTIKEAAVTVTHSAFWWKTVLTTAATLFAYTSLTAGVSMIAPYYPIVAQQHNIPVYVSGFVIGTAPLCVTLTSTLLGYLLPHLGLKFTQLAGLFLAGGSLILFGFVPMMPTPALFIAFSFIIQIVDGIGTAMYATASYTQLTQFYPDKKGKIVGMMELALSIGYAMGPAIGGGLQEVGGFPLPFLIVGGCIVILMLLLIVLVPQIECTSVKLPWRLVLKLLTNIVFVLLVASLVLSIGTQCAVIAYFGQFLFFQFKLSVGIIGIIYLASLLMYAVGTIFAGQLTDKLNIHRCLIIIGLVVSLAACLLIGPAEFITTPKLWLSVLTWVVFGAGISFANIPVYSDIHGIAKRVHESEAALASILPGVVVGGIYAGECLGPIIGGALVYGVGFRSMTVVFSAMLLVCAVVLVIATVIQKVLNSNK